MRNPVFRLLTALIILSSLFSCKKSSDGGGDSTPTMSQEKVDEGRNVQDEKPPRSEKTEGDFEFEGENVTSPVNLQDDEDANAKIDILTAGTGASSAKIAADGDMYGWYAEYFGDTWVENEYIYFFRKNGTYLYYDQENSTWDWGYYYVNKSLTMLVTDYNSDFEKWWKINELTPTKCVWDHKTEGEITLTGFTLNGSEKAEMTLAKFQSKAVGKNWYLTEFNAGKVINQDSSRYYQFKQDGMMYGFKYDDQLLTFVPDDTLKYSVNSDWSFNVINDEVDLDLELMYLTNNQFSLFGKENGDGDKGLFNNVFQTQARMQATYEEYNEMLVEQ